MEDADRPDSTEGPRDSPDDWERTGRETLCLVLDEIQRDITIEVENLASSVYWNGHPHAEQLERLRQSLFELQYVTEEYLAELCPETEPEDSPSDRTPAWLPAVTNQATRSTAAQARGATDDT